MVCIEPTLDSQKHALTDVMSNEQQTLAQCKPILQAVTQEIEAVTADIAKLQKQFDNLTVAHDQQALDLAEDEKTATIIKRVVFRDTRKQCETHKLVFFL